MKLLDIIKAAIAALFNNKAALTAAKTENDTLRATVESQASTIADLKAKVLLDEANDAELIAKAAAAEQAAAEATARAEALSGGYAAAEEQAKELAKMLTDEPSVPSVDENFVITAPEVTAPSAPMEVADVPSALPDSAAASSAASVESEESEESSEESSEG